MWYKHKVYPHNGTLERISFKNNCLCCSTGKFQLLSRLHPQAYLHGWPQSSLFPSSHGGLSSCFSFPTLPSTCCHLNTHRSRTPKALQPALWVSSFTLPSHTYTYISPLIYIGLAPAPRLRSHLRLVQLNNLYTSSTHLAPVTQLRHWPGLKQARSSHQTHNKRKKSTCPCNITKIKTKWTAKTGCFPWNPSPTEMSPNENYLDKPRTQLKRMIVNFITEFKEFKRHEQSHTDNINFKGIASFAKVFKMF